MKNEKHPVWEKPKIEIVNIDPKDIITVSTIHLPLDPW